MKMNKISAFIICTVICILIGPAASHATAPAAGEEALFTSSTAPDALLVLDLSGSMLWAPPGRDMYTSSSASCGDDVAYYSSSEPTHTKLCKAWPYTTGIPGTYNMYTPYYSNTSCSGPFYFSSRTGYSTDCRRLEIAKRAIFDILDDNDDNTVNSSDEASLGIRIGYMRFVDCGSDDTGGSYTSGCNQIPGSSSSRRYIGSKYSQIYCNSSTSCTVTSTGSYSVGGASASDGTPLASALSEAKIYLDAHKAADSAGACRQKFAILISDGADTFACSGDGSEDQADMYKRRRESVARAKALANAGYKVFVIGFGAGMPDYLKYTLNWMAYYGSTDNPNEVNSGSTSAYSISNTACTPNATPPVTTHCCDMTTNPTMCFPSGVTSCVVSATTGTCDGSSTDCFATSNDPGNTALSGYAFLASDADALATALKTAINIIREATYSFSTASVQSSRTQDENFLYEASFEPVSGDPFWLGHLKKFQINTDGSVGSELADAGNVLKAASSSSRTMKTCLGCTTTLSDFSASIDKSYFGVSTDGERDAIVGYIKGEPAYNPDCTPETVPCAANTIFKLGDVFRSTPITVGTPSAFFDDIRDQNNIYSCNTVTGLNAFGKHRCDHERTSALGNRLIVAGANDGQMHAFKTSDMSEAWTFIPPNLLPKLKNITHTTDPTALTHQYFVDGPVTVADVWVGTGAGTAKTNSEWKTILIFGEARGATPNLWSSSQYCDSGFNAVYSATYPHYCGYYALDLDDSLHPTFKWRLRGAGTDGAMNATAPDRGGYLGDPWGKVMTGRVKIDGNEKWVGFVGAGYNMADCSGGGSCDTRGKGFYIIDLSTGQILWSYTHADNGDMDYSVAAPAAIVDTDNDGFIDTAYIGDMGGSVWRLKFCTNLMTSCNTSSWTGGRLFGSSTGTIRPIYTVPAVTADGGGNLWVYWGTGDKTDPTAANAQEKFFGMKDNDRTTTYGVNDLDNITSTGSTYDNATSPKVGYYINLSGSGEKILADPTVFGGVVYFTTYTPPSGSNPCEQGGTASLFGIRYTSGAGAFPGGGRSMNIGSGIPSSPVISLKPGGGSNVPDLYVTVSGGGGVSGGTHKVPFDPPGLSNRTNILYWKDRRIQ